jgi:hypothetical protein
MYVCMCGMHAHTHIKIRGGWLMFVCMYVHVYISTYTKTRHKEAGMYVANTWLSSKNRVCTHIYTSMHICIHTCRIVFMLST